MAVEGWEPESLEIEIRESLATWDHDELYETIVSAAYHNATHDGAMHGVAFHVVAQVEKQILDASDHELRNIVFRLAKATGRREGAEVWVDLSGHHRILIGEVEEPEDASDGV